LEKIDRPGNPIQVESELSGSTEKIIVAVMVRRSAAEKLMEARIAARIQ
jgi:hypothetical protein